MLSFAKLHSDMQDHESSPQKGSPKDRRTSLSNVTEVRDSSKSTVVDVLRLRTEPLLIFSWERPMWLESEMDEELDLSSLATAERTWEDGMAANKPRQGIELGKV
jgi:hypothetical protein